MWNCWRMEEFEDPDQWDSSGTNTSDELVDAHSYRTLVFKGEFQQAEEGAPYWLYRIPGWTAI